MSETIAQSPRREEIGHAITVLRVVRGWSQGELAHASRVAGSAISEYERGRKIPGLMTLRRLIEAMGYPLAAVDHTAAFIDSLKAGTFAHVPPPSSTGTPGPPPSGGRWALSWEIDQASAEYGRATARVTRVGLYALHGRPTDESAVKEDT
jgi:transcriptional regulator with XRE-family HTH domain